MYAQGYTVKEKPTTSSDTRRGERSKHQKTTNHPSIEYVTVLKSCNPKYLKRDPLEFRGSMGPENSHFLLI